MTEPERQLSSLVEQVAELSNKLDSRLISREPELDAIRADLQIVEAQLAFLRQPDDLQVARRLLDKLNEFGRALPDDIQEKILRLELRHDPYSLNLTRPLVALLYGKLGRSPLPQLPVTASDVAAPPSPGGVDELLKSAEDHAESGDIFALLAALWQAVIRSPNSARGWAEYARHLANRGDWTNCRSAARQAMKLWNASETAGAISLLSALSVLADEQQLGNLDWKAWLRELPAALQTQPALLNLFVQTGNKDSAETLLPQVVKERSNDAAAWLAASKVAYDGGRLTESYDYLRRALELDLRSTLHQVVRTTSGATWMMLRELDKSDEIADWISQASRNFHEINLVPARPSAEALIAARRMRMDAQDRGLPSALLITQARSASTSIGNIFSSGFSLPTVLYALVMARVVAPWLENFLLGGGCYVTHLLPSPKNIDLLAQGGARNVIVNVRDPRQLIISMVEHLRTYPDQWPPTIRQRVIGDDADAIDFAIDKMLPETIDWIEGWIGARDKLTVNFTTYEEFVADKDRFLEKIIAYYGGEPKYFRRDLAITEHAGIDYHRRKGQVDEWRDRMTSQQAKRATEAIPNHFWDLFGWQP